MPALLANHRIGNYRVVRLIGEGGMGLVYEAVRDDIGVRAALKVLRPELAHNAEVAGRFINEARAVNMVQHPGVVRVFDYGQLPTGEAYLAMEFLEGDSLRTRLARYVRLSEADAMRLGRQLASAVAAAHAKQIVHRDLKPENVMLLEDADAPGGERAKVLDFGIAKLDAGNPGAVQTRTNMMMGTPVYMAPEQCRGLKTITDRADVYSLGVMLFEMLAGRTPFVSEAPGDLIAMHVLQPPPSLRDFLPDVDPMLQRLLEAMLSKEPQQRPQMSDVAQQLKALGHLQSEVMPMQVVRSPSAELRSAEPIPVPPQWQRNVPAPKPEELLSAVVPPPAVKASPAPAPAPAPAPVRAGDADPTVQLRESGGNPLQPGVLAAGSASAPAKSPSSSSLPVKSPSSSSLPVKSPSSGAQPLKTTGGSPPLAKAAAPRPSAAPVPPPGVHDMTRHVGLESEPTTAFHAEDAPTRSGKPTKEQQKRLERMVLIGMVLVAILLSTLVLLLGNHGEGSR